MPLPPDLVLATLRVLKGCIPKLDEVSIPIATTGRTSGRTMKTLHVLSAALALVFTIASPALSKDLCVQVDEGIFAGSVIVLKGLKQAPGQYGPVHGYLRRFNAGLPPGFGDAFPLHGQALVSSTGNLVVGLTWPLARIGVGGDVSTLVLPSANQTLWLACTAGPDGKVGVLDSCPNAFVLNDNVASHVIPCKDAPDLP